MDRVLNQARFERDNLPLNMSIGYVNLIRQNILTGKYDASYPPYSERYYHWKYFIVGSSGGFWFLKGYLFNALVSFRFQNGWMGGVPPGLLVEGSSWYGKGYTGKPAYIGEYARWMEYGTLRQPARPLFTPTLEEYKSDSALKEAIKSLKKVGSQWR